jgi:hypothetical protein
MGQTVVCLRSRSCSSRRLFECAECVIGFFGDLGWIFFFLDLEFEVDCSVWLFLFFFFFVVVLFFPLGLLCVLGFRGSAFSGIY